MLENISCDVTESELSFEKNSFKIGRLWILRNFFQKDFFARRNLPTKIMIWLYDFIINIWFTYVPLKKLKKLPIVIIKWTAEAVTQRCSIKKVFLEISQNSQENTCARVSFLIKLQASGQ